MQKCTLGFVIAVALLSILQPPKIEARMTLPQLKNAMKGMAKTCVGKTGVSPEIAGQTSKGAFPPDKALMCYFLCLYSAMKVVKDGRINIPMINKQIDMMMPTDIIEKAKTASADCDAKSNSDDDCERIWQFTKCYYESDPSIYFFP